MPVYRAETKFSTKKAGYSALSCVTAKCLIINDFAVKPLNKFDDFEGNIHVQKENL